jgi:ABC-type glutathione transport system ATPase component
MASIVDVRGLHFRYGRNPTSSHNDSWILRDVDLAIESSATVGIVGESGSGKTTLVRLLCGLLQAGKGTAEFEGRGIADWLDGDPALFRRKNQLVFQSPANSFDPRMRIRQSLAEPVKATERRRVDVEEMTGWLAEVGLGREVLSRYPHQLSGGQLQRIALARALSVNPSVLYADEPTSALDVSVQAQILNLLMELRAEHGLTLVVVSHDLAVVSRICQHLVVMKDGEVVEQGNATAVLQNPASDYTVRLIAAAQAVSLVTP